MVSCCLGQQISGTLQKQHTRSPGQRGHTQWYASGLVKEQEPVKCRGSHVYPFRSGVLLQCILLKIAMYGGDGDKNVPEYKEKEHWRAREVTLNCKGNLYLFPLVELPNLSSPLSFPPYLSKLWILTWRCQVIIFSPDPSFGHSVMKCSHFWPPFPKELLQDFHCTISFHSYSQSFVGKRLCDWAGIIWEPERMHSVG